jgi:hypothetical protein
MPNGRRADHALPSPATKVNAVAPNVKRAKDSVVPPYAPDPAVRARSHREPTTGPREPGPGGQHDVRVDQSFVTDL